jgi:ABC-type transport system involved in multi-copper enzyme maturation permease subunit
MQTLAIFVDAYRNLNAKKMFWVVLAFSLLVAGSFALVEINDSGIKVCVWQFDSFFNTNIITPALFYKIMFVNLGIGVWLTWLATIKALTSTAGIFPDLINSRSVDLLVAKPISRLRLFLLQYAAGLSFVTLQVSVFCLASFLVIGFRGGAWEPGIFLAIPLVVVFFSYLFSVCVFLGVLTRSTVAALFLTLLFWAGVFAVGTTEEELLKAITMKQEGVSWREMHRRPPHRSEGAAAVEPAPDEDAKAQDSAGEEEKQPTFAKAIGGSLLKAFIATSEDSSQGELADGSGEEDETHEELSNLETAQKITFALKTVLPKTTETMGLLKRYLISQAELPQLPAEQGTGRWRVEQKVEGALRARSVTWVVGTSLLFELFVLAGAAWIFCRRDF